MPHEEANRVAAWVSRLLLGVVCLIVYWSGNGATSLWDRDEPRYAEAARVMARTGDTIVPYFNGEFRFQKPILSYWLIGLAYRLFGETPFAARFFSGLAVAGACLIVAWLGDRMFGRPAGIIAGWMVALCPVFVLLGKLCIPDGTQLFFATLCYACLYRTYRPVESDRRGAARAALLFWVGLGLAILTKGPIVPGMLAATFLVHKLLTGAPLGAFHLRWRAGLLVLAAITLPWFLAIGVATGSDFFAESVGRQLAGRAVESFDGKWLPPGYYAASLALGFAPWLALAVLSLLRFRRQWRVEGPIAFLIAWVLGPMLLLELFRSKQMHYLAPSYAALALLSAGYLARLTRGDIEWVRDRWANGCALSTTLLGWTLAGTFAALAWFGPAPLVVGASLAAGMQAVVAIACGRALLAGAAARAVVIQSAALAVLWFGAGALLAPAVERARIVRPIAERLARESEASGAEVVLHQVIEAGLVHYSGMTIPKYFWIEDLLRKARYSSHDLVTPVTEEHYRRLLPHLGDRIEVLQTWRGWVKMHRDTVHLIRITPGSEQIASQADSAPR